MSRLYDTVEPSVIDEDMLQKAVEEQGPKEEAGKIAKEEGLNFSDVTALRMDFKNILKIDNLWGFSRLVKLQMDNNIIERIEGLDILTQLKWLDLSFNNIEVIEGLDNLVNLEDLTLYNNRIQHIENMDALSKLHVFSIGNNDINELENVTYLRRFKSLQTVNLCGNPICQTGDEYIKFVVAHLPHVEYLDYRMVHDDVRQAAGIKYEISIQEIQHDEAQADRKHDEQSVKGLELELHKAAFVESMDGTQLFESLYTEDAEGRKLNDMPGMDEILIGFKEKFSGICRQIFDHGINKHNERKKEVDTFWECIEDAKKDNKELGSAKIEDFLTYKKKLWIELSQISDQKILEDKISDYNQGTADLWEGLMGFEMQLVDQLEDAIKDYERNMFDMVGLFMETVQGFTSQLRDLEKQHNEKIKDIAMDTVEKVIKNELEDDIMTDDLRELFVDKDTVINAVQSSHDVHMLKIDNREEELTNRVKAWQRGMMDDIRDSEEVRRNRSRVTEINNLIDHLREEVDNLDLHQQGY